MAKPTTIMVFAKAPTPGEVKTRLIPALGAEGAAGLQRRMTRHTLETACALSDATVELWCAPGIDDSFFAGCAADFPVALRLQQGQSLGERMLKGFRSALAQSELAILIGTDCPRLGPDTLRAARDVLAQDGRGVLVPALDGGYVLIGLNRVADRIFQDIDWGTDQVLRQTRERFRDLRWKCGELPAMRDLDRPEDLREFPELCESWKTYAHLAEINL
ncbi:MAG: TIGR04282 family arsenosugar biosynthesis glycosyltransferase [Pseudomonadota bacterium]|nr:MAG: TIGR04282 family arsenosugar biosynthesis glycosyltransferase [Pseudomonadota bacterium]